MPLHKRTYALPAETLEQFEQVVAPDQRSAVIAELLREWLDQATRQRLRADLIDGCREMAEIYLEIEREYHPLEEEVHGAVDTHRPTRRHRPRKTGSS